MKNIVILGAGESGVGAAILAQKLGYQVFVSDLGAIASEYKEVLINNKIAFEEQQHSEAKILAEADLVVKSPGIPDKVALVAALKNKGIAVIDELEFAGRHTQAKIIAITGSNGKTTTTRLIYEMLKADGYSVGLAGNVGFSMAKQVAENDRDYYVVEVSSFQLDGMISFCPTVAILLNITPDHLDRYDYELKNYIASKCKIIQNGRADQIFIWNSDDENIVYGLEHFCKKNRTNTKAISMAALQQETAWLNVPYSDFRIAKSELTLQGRHNYFNIQAAVLAAQSVGVSEAAIRKALQTFQNEAHRLELVCNINGVSYINDSKATNIDAVFYALEAMKKTVVWIVGGIDKGNDYSILYPLVKQKVRAIICLGKDNSRIFKAFEGVHEVILETRSVQEAIKVASLYAEPGEVVLLSPACSSFDLFANYKARGNQFKAVLLQQIKIMTEGVKISMNTNFEMNPTEHKEDN